MVICLWLEMSLWSLEYVHLNDTENLNSYFTENILRLHYQYQYMNAIQRHSRYLFRENAKRFIYFLRPQAHFCVCI